MLAGLSLQPLTISKTAETKPLALAPRLQPPKNSELVSTRRQRAMNVQLAAKRARVAAPNRSLTAVVPMEVDHIGPVCDHPDLKPNTPVAALAAIDNCIRIAALAAAHHLVVSTS